MVLNTQVTFKWMDMRNIRLDDIVDYHVLEVSVRNTIFHNIRVLTQISATFLFMKIKLDQNFKAFFMFNNFPL